MVLAALAGVAQKRNRLGERTPERFTLGYSRHITKDFPIHVDGVYSHTLHDWRTMQPFQQF